MCSKMVFSTSSHVIEKIRGVPIFFISFLLISKQEEKQRFNCSVFWWYVNSHHWNKLLYLFNIKEYLFIRGHILEFFPSLKLAGTSSVLLWVEDAVPRHALLNDKCCYSFWASSNIRFCINNLIRFEILILRINIPCDIQENSRETETNS